MNKNNTSGTSGVSYTSRFSKYKTVISVHGIRKHIGYYQTLPEAVTARKNAERLYYATPLFYFLASEANIDKSLYPQLSFAVITAVHLYATSSPKKSLAAFILAYLHSNPVTPKTPSPVSKGDVPSIMEKSYPMLHQLLFAAPTKNLGRFAQKFGLSYPGFKSALADISSRFVSENFLI